MITQGLKLIGLLISILGAAALAEKLKLVAIQTPFIWWMDRFGDASGWVIRAGTLALGLSLVFMAPRGDH